jgi:hypothetical protein
MPRPEPINGNVLELSLTEARPKHYSVSDIPQPIRTILNHHEDLRRRAEITAMAQPYDPALRRRLCLAKRKYH